MPAAFSISMDCTALPCASPTNERQSRGEQPGEGPVDPVLGNVAPLCRGIEIAEVGQNEFVGNGGIIEGYRSGEIAVASDAMRVGRLRPQQRRDQDSASAEESRLDI